MPANIEIKARVEDPAEMRWRAERMSDTPAHEIRQEDVFFYCPGGRLKLRILGPERGELIFYERPDVLEPSQCDYQIFHTDNPTQLRRVLAEAWGEIGRVCKQRVLLHSGQTRIHLDNVEGLGSFVELEVVLKEGQTSADGKVIIEALMEQLEIDEVDLVEGAYLDLLRSEEHRSPWGRRVIFM